MLLLFAGGIDEEFDLLGSRTAQAPASGTGIDLLGGDTAWNMGGLDAALPNTGAPPGAGGENLEDDALKQKDPKKFLGTHAGLVNLDNLVSKPPGAKC